ncbi:MAG: dihydropteroate synthase [Desulfovibrio sp.]|nr:dihydropteroate synthase [Desulfovibrio sp.]
MGIVNCTDDSFYAQTRTPRPRQAIRRALDLIAQGAHILDLGAESSRPYAQALNPADERARLLPVLTSLKNRGAFLSVDTWHAKTAAMALDCGCSIINDISAARWDPELLDVLVSWKPGYVLMHSGGRPWEMQDNPVYSDVVDEELRFFSEQMNRLVRAGLPEERIVLDLGIGFGKNLSHNLALLRAAPRFLSFGRPLLVGLSMKSLFQKLFGLATQDRVLPTQVACALLLERGVFWHRVHHVAETRRTLLLTLAMQQKAQNDPMSSSDVP